MDMDTVNLKMALYLVSTVFFDTICCGFLLEVPIYLLKNGIQIIESFVSVLTDQSA